MPRSLSLSCSGSFNHRLRSSSRRSRAVRGGVLLSSTTASLQLADNRVEASAPICYRAALKFWRRFSANEFDRLRYRHAYAAPSGTSDPTAGRSRSHASSIASFSSPKSGTALGPESPGWLMTPRPAAIDFQRHPQHASFHHAARSIRAMESSWRFPVFSEVGKLQRRTSFCRSDHWFYVACGPAVGSGSGLLPNRPSA